MLAVVGIWQFAQQSAQPQPPAQPAVALTNPSDSTTQALPPEAKSEPPPTSTPDIKPIEPSPPEKASTTPLLDQLLKESRPWFDSVADNRWFVQLFTAIDADRPEQVEAFLVQVRNAGLEMAQVRVYHLNIEKKDRYGIIYGDYVSRKDAVIVLDRLPAEIRRYRPYPRQAIRLKLENSTPNKG